MRAVVTLQLLVGFGALFGAGYLAVAPVVEPVSDAVARRAAFAEARAAASDVALEIGGARDAHRRAIEAISASPVLRGDAGTGPERERGWTVVLEAAVAQAGGGVAALLEARGTALASTPGAQGLTGLDGVARAASGQSLVTLESLDGLPHIVALGPVRGTAPGMVLAVAKPIDETRLRTWTRALPAHVFVSVVGRAGDATSTAPESLRATVHDAAAAASVESGEDVYEVFSREVRDDSGASLRVVGAARRRASDQAPLSGHVRLLLGALGAAALVLTLVVLALAGPSALPVPVPGDAGRPEAQAPPAVAAAPVPAPVVAAEPPAAPPPPVAVPAVVAPSPAPTAPSVAGSAPVEPSTPAPASLAFPPSPAGPAPHAEAYVQKTLPALLPSAVAPAPIVVAPPEERAAPPPAEARSAGARAPSGPSPFGAPSPFARTGAGVAPPVDPANAGAAPSVGPVSRSVPDGMEAPPAPASAFDAIANAALSSPPTWGGAPAGADPLPDLPVPKAGLSPEVLAAQRADALRANVSGAAHAFRPTPPEGVSSPPLAAAQPWSSGAVPLPGSGAPRPPAPTAEAAPDPWRNPSVPAYRAAPSPASSPVIRTSHLPGYSPSAPAEAQPQPRSAVGGVLATMEFPRPFDEDHYREVYNEFVASKAQLGESVENITFDGFRTKLRTSEQQLLERHGCRSVRFQVLVKDRTVSLRPQLVR
jgi:hypothetical protein